VSVIVVLVVAALLFRLFGDPWVVVAGKSLVVGILYVVLYLFVVYVVFGKDIPGVQ
jgi:hypothetical protein